MVIKDDKEMNRFIKFLVQAIKTKDGNAGTAQFLIDAATESEIQRQEKDINKRIQRTRDSTPLAEDEEYEDWLSLKKLDNG